MLGHLYGLGYFTVYVNRIGLAVTVGSSRNNLYIIIARLYVDFSDTCNLGRSGKRLRCDINRVNILADNQIVLKRFVVKRRSQCHILNREIFKIRVRVGCRCPNRIGSLLFRHILEYRNLKDDCALFILAGCPHGTGLIGRSLNVRHILVRVKRMRMITGHIKLLIVKGILSL